MDSSCLIFTLKACCPLLRVSGTISWAQQTLLVTLLPISLFTAPRKPWLYCTISPDFIYVRDFTQTPKLFMLSWMSFAGGHKSAHTHTDTHTSVATHTQMLCTHTLQRVPFLQATAPLILSDLKFVCSLLQRAPSMIPGSLRAPFAIIPPLSFPSLLCLRLSWGWSSCRITPTRTNAHAHKHIQLISTERNLKEVNSVQL